MAEPAPPGDDEHFERVLTVIKVRERGDETEVLFAESARIYRLARSAAGYRASLAMLRGAFARGTAVRVRFDRPHGEVIERVSGIDT